MNVPLCVWRFDVRHQERGREGVLCSVGVSVVLFLLIATALVRYSLPPLSAKVFSEQSKVGSWWIKEVWGTCRVRSVFSRLGGGDVLEVGEHPGRTRFMLLLNA